MREKTDSISLYVVLHLAQRENTPLPYEQFSVGANHIFVGLEGTAMPIIFERNICCNLDETIEREWLITNGLGGYAAGTVAGTLTRMQHGLLVASLPEDTTPQLLLAKIDEEVVFDQRTYYLGTNEYLDGTLNPAGFVHLESFRLEEGFPVFTYRLGGLDGIMLEKRIWMIQGQNTTCIQYRVLRTSALRPDATNEPPYWRGSRSGYTRSYNYVETQQPPLTLTLLPLVAHRAYDQPQYGDPDRQFEVQTLDTSRNVNELDVPLALPAGMAGCAIRPRDTAPLYYILACGDAQSSTQFIPTGVWYWRFLRRHDQAAGLPATDDLYLPGVIRARLSPGQDSTLTIVVTAEELTPQFFNQKQLHATYEQALDYQRGLLQTQSYFGEGGGSVQTLPALPLPASAHSTIEGAEFLQLLHQAGNRFLVQRTLSYQERSDAASFFFHAAERVPTITPGYYAVNDRTREALISLPGLMLTTRRYSEARRMLRHLGRYFHQGLLPDRLPTAQHPKLANEDYGSVDTTLWYFYALDKYLSATHDYELLDELYPRLADSLAWYTQGTLHGIQVDSSDGLLRTGAPERALTWMDALDHGKPVTPRTGKPVEVNALWYHALSLMQEWSQILYQRGRTNYLPQQYAEQRASCQRSFNTRFWYQEGGYLYDLVDGPADDDICLRPNQLLAISLRHAVLDTHRQAAVLEVVTRSLVTPYGLRTLAPCDPDYQGQLPLLHAKLPHALHQGSIWPWLIGPYTDTLLKVGMQTSVQASGNSSGTTGHDLYKEYIWRKGLQTLEPFCQLMQRHLLGNISNVYAGDAPHLSGFQSASALSISEILRAYKVLAHMGVQHTSQATSV